MNAKKILLLVGIVLFIISGAMAYQAHQAHENAQSAISNQSLDLKLYGWSGANSSYYETYEMYTKKENTYKLISILSVVGGLGLIAPQVLKREK